MSGCTAVLNIVGGSDGLLRHGAGVACSLGCLRRVVSELERNYSVDHFEHEINVHLVLEVVEESDDVGVVESVHDCQLVVDR